MLESVPRGLRTRFAPAPTGYLHLGHVANAIYVWGVARATGARVTLRIEDHDAQRSRAEYADALLEDLAWLGFVPDEGPVRQSDALEQYEAALARLREKGLVYACACSRSRFADTGWRGEGCPAGCRRLALGDAHGRVLRVVLGGGAERWDDLLQGPRAAPVAERGDLAVRDTVGNWTYGFAVVVDDLSHDVGLVVRGLDLVDATGSQIRLARLLGRQAPPLFLHHPLVRKPGGAKLSKADRDTSVRELRARGASAEGLIGVAAAAVGLIERPRPIAATGLASLVR